MLPRRAFGLMQLSCRALNLRRRAALLRRHDHERGFAIGAILFILTMVGVGGAVLYSGYSQILRTNIEITRDNAAKNDLLAAARTLSATSAMINGGLNIQPPAVLPFASADSARLPGGYANAGASGAPAAVGVMQAVAGTRQLDPWNHYYIYCRWENAASPGTDPALLLISAGPDGVLNTGCGDVVAQNDDRIELLSVAQAVDRANVWQYQPTSSGAQVQFGITGNAVQVTNQGDISANSLTLAGPLNASALTLATPLAIGQGGTGASDAATARTNLGSGTAGDAVFTATTAAGARGALGSTTVGEALFTAATADTGRSALGATTFGSSMFTVPDYSAALDLLGAQTTGKALFLSEDVDDALAVLQSGNPVGRSVFKAATTTAARSALGAGTVGDAVFAAGTAAVARAAIGAGATGDAVFAAANPNTALTALGLIGGSATLDIGITGTANTAIYLADGGNILAGTVPVARGGTGAGDAATARANLGADNASNLTGGTLSWSRLPTSGVTAGSYNWGTVNQYGLVEAAQNVATNSLSQNNSGIVVTDTTPGIGTDGQIVFTLEGDTKAVMDYRGFLGLATAAPQDRLHIAGGTDGNSALRLEGANNTERFIRFTTNANERWELGVNDTNESGSDIGSDFVIRNYDDAGTLLGTPFSIERATGNVTFNGTVTATSFVGGGAGSNITLGTSAAAANPARGGEVTTGLFSPDTGVVAVANNGAESLRVAANGNVGIGANDPGARLEVAGTGWNDATGGDMRVTNSNLTGAGLTLKATGTGGASYSLISTATSAGIGAGGFGIYDNAMDAYRLALPLNGGIRIPANAGTDNFTTPVGSSVPTKINIPLFNPGAFGQILIAGLPATAPASARAMSFVDARTVQHQPTLGIFSPDEQQIMGFTYDGSNTAGYLSSTVALGLKVAATTEAMHIDTVGNVGIGTSNPASRLTVQAAASTDTPLRLNRTNGTALFSFSANESANYVDLIGPGATLRFFAGAGTLTSYGNFGVAGAASFMAQNAAQTPVTIQAAAGQTANLLQVTSNGGAAGDRVVVTGGGNVGIGATAPNTLLSLNPTNGNQAKITLWEASAASHYGFGITSGQLNYDSLGAHVFYLGSKNGAGTELMRVNSTGVGIGRSPSLKLDVNGPVGIGGVQALQLTSSGNPILGNTAMSTTLAPLSVGIGRDALAGVTTEVSSVALGHQALATAATGTNNTAVGYRALNLGTGGSNTAVGYSAMTATTTGANNTGVGTFALLAQNQGSANVALGRGALSSVTSGNNNLGLGYSVGSTILTIGSNNILIGTSNAVTTPAADTNNWINLGNQFVSDGATTGSEAIGLNRNTTGTPGTTALIVGTGAGNGNGALLTAAGVWTNASDRRIKENIQPLGYGLDAIMRLRPVSYKMKDSHVPQIGFIAQEVEQVMPEVVVQPGDLNDPSQHYTLAYGNMVAATVKAIQDLKAENDNLRHAMAALRASAPTSPTASPSALPAWLLVSGCIVLLLGLGGLGMMLIRLRREVRRLQKVV